MRVRKCVITAAGPEQRRLPLQTLIARDGAPKTVLALLVEEASRARIEETCLVAAPGDEAAYREAAGAHPGRLHFVTQHEPRGYAAALLCAREFASGEPFLHMVSDHLWVDASEEGCAARLVETAEREQASVSAVKATRESHLPRFGAVGGRPVAARPGMYDIETEIEKPTPTEAERSLVVPGQRAGQYLCFFGMHVLTPCVMELLDGADTHSGALAQLPRKERYLALEMAGRRYDLGDRYGLFCAQLALALAGKDRDEVLTLLVELLAR